MHCCAPATSVTSASGEVLLPVPVVAPPPAAGPFRPAAADRHTRGQLSLPGDTFAMGDAFGEGYPEDGEGPVHDVHLDPFRIDATAVTNAAFAGFVKATGYVTDAERLGMSAVFHLTVQADPRDPGPQLRRVGR